jgi:hypothetical protein
MRLYFGGAEQKGWRELLYANGVRDTSLSFVGLLGRTTKPERFNLGTELPEDTNIFVDSGGYSYNKEDSSYSVADVYGISVKYERFIEANVDRIEMFSEFDANVMNPADRNALNNRLRSIAPDKFLPLWHPAGNVALPKIGRIGVMAGDAVDMYAARLNRVVQDYGVKLHGVAMTQIKAMRDVKWDSVGSTSWLSPSRYGDTIIWDGRELKRYPKDYKGQGRAGHKRWIQDNGFNYGLIDADDSTEMLRLSIWSWLEYVKYLNRLNRVTQLANMPDDENTEPGNEVVAHNSGPVRNRKLLPVLGVEYTDTIEIDDEGEEHIVRKSKYKAATQSLMKCNTCIVQDRCPEFKEDADCAYDIPMDLGVPRAEDELWTTITEMQAQRVFTLRMFEQLSSGGYDPNTGPEIDRLIRMMNAKKKQGQTTIRQVTEVNLPQGEGGFLGSLLGPSAADRLHKPQIEQGEDPSIVDAEVIEDE